LSIKQRVKSRTKSKDNNCTNPINQRNEVTSHLRDQLSQLNQLNQPPDNYRENQPQMTIFSRIIAGEIPCYKIAEDDRFFAFLDINPLSKGHTLIIPKLEEDYIFHLDDDTLSGMILFAKKVALAIEKSVPCIRIGVAVIGLEVPHAHIHLIPINRESDMNFKNPKLKLPTEEMTEIAAGIRKKLME